MASPEVTRRDDPFAAEQWIRRLSRLEPKHEFFAPPARLQGAMLEDRVAHVLETLYGAQVDEHGRQVAAALQRLYGAQR